MRASCVFRNSAKNAIDLGLFLGLMREELPVHKRRHNNARPWLSVLPGDMHPECEQSDDARMTSSESERLAQFCNRCLECANDVLTTASELQFVDERVDIDCYESIHPRSFDLCNGILDATEQLLAT